jgi:hypothetical protein
VEPARLGRTFLVVARAAEILRLRYPVRLRNCALLSTTWRLASDVPRVIIVRCRLRRSNTLTALAGRVVSARARMGASTVEKAGSAGHVRWDTCVRCRRLCVRCRMAEYAARSARERGACNSNACRLAGDGLKWCECCGRFGGRLCDGRWGLLVRYLRVHECEGECG